MATQQTMQRRAEYRIERAEEVSDFLEEQEEAQRRAEADADEFAAYLVDLRRSEGMPDEDERDDEEEGEVVEGDHFIDFESDYWSWVDSEHAKFSLDSVHEADLERAEQRREEELLAEADDDGDTLLYLQDVLEVQKILAGFTKE
jgi:hypothetical protein